MRPADGIEQSCRRITPPAHPPYWLGKSVICAFWRLRPLPSHWVAAQFSERKLRRTLASKWSASRTACLCVLLVKILSEDGYRCAPPILRLGAAFMAITTRPVAKHDLKLICEHRERMFAESGRTREALRPMTVAFEQWLSPRLEDGSYFGWMLEDAGVVIAGLGMMVIDWPPHPSHPADHRRAYILNVFVEPEHRRKGLAKRLMALAEERARELGICYAILHSTRQGRPLYESLGWGPTSEMAIRWE